MEVQEDSGQRDRRHTERCRTHARRDSGGLPDAGVAPARQRRQGLKMPAPEGARANFGESLKFERLRETVLDDGLRQRQLPAARPWLFDALADGDKHGNDVILWEIDEFPH